MTKRQNIVNRINNSSMNTRFTEAEDYGLDPQSLSWFKRRFSFFKEYLAQVINSVWTSEFQWLKNEPRSRFIDLVLSYTLMEFFYGTDGKEYDVEDFGRNGEMEGYKFIVKEIFGSLIGKIYDELTQ